MMEGDTIKLCAMEPCMQLKIFPLLAGIELGPPARQASTEPTELQGLCPKYMYKQADLGLHGLPFHLQFLTHC